MTTPNEIDIHCHRLMLMVLRCKNTMDRTAVCYGVLKREDTGDLQAAAARCIKAGLIQFGTTNASAKAWSRGASDQLLYLTKAGKAWLRAQGTDFGSSKVTAHTLGMARRPAVISITTTPAVFAHYSVGVA